MNLFNFDVAERNHEATQDRKWFDMQDRLERSQKEKAKQVEFDVNNAGGEYYFLNPANLLEAITESGFTFQEQLGAAMQKNDAQAVLKLIADESKTYWTQWLRDIS